MRNGSRRVPKLANPPAACASSLRVQPAASMSWILSSPPCTPSQPCRGWLLLAASQQIHPILLWSNTQEGMEHPATRLRVIERGTFITGRLGQVRRTCACFGFWVGCGKMLGLAARGEGSRRRSLTMRKQTPGGECTVAWSFAR